MHNLNGMSRISCSVEFSKVPLHKKKNFKEQE